MLYTILPRQLCPSPMNPGLQEQLNEPSLLVQVALCLLQVWALLRHSSMSERESTDYTYARGCMDEKVLHYIFVINQACSVKMAGYWHNSFFEFLWTETKSGSIILREKNKANIQPS